MGYVTARARQDFLPLTITFHLLLIACIVIAMTAQWARVNFGVTNPSWVVSTGSDASAGAFKCPTSTWYVFAYNGFCHRQSLDRGSRGKHGDTNCITWDNQKPWRKMDQQNLLGSRFSDGRESWQAVGALLALSLLLTCITTLTTAMPEIYNPWNLSISTFMIGINFCSLLVAWILAETSDQMQPNYWDGMDGCGNSSFKHTSGFGFAVVASALAFFLFFLTMVAAGGEAISRMNVLYDAKTGAVVRGEETKYDTTPPEDRQVQGYRPDIVA